MKVLGHLLSLLVLSLLVNCTKAQTQIKSTEDGFTSLICVRKDGKFGFLNERGEEIIPCAFDEITSFSEGWAALKKGKKWAYYDARGRKVLDLGNRFTYCGPFNDGLAFVSTSPTPKIGHMYASFYENLCQEIKFINKEGEVVYEIEGSQDIECSQLIKLGYSNGLLKVVKKSDGSRLIAYYDKKGKIVLPFKERLQSSIKDKFTEGLLVSALRKDPDSRASRKLYGYINKSGDWQIPPKFIKALPFSNGVAVVWEAHPTRELNYITYIINKKGEKVFPENVRTNENFVRDSILAVFKPNLNDEGVEVFGSYGKSRRYALARVDGSYITDFIYAELRPGKTSSEPWLASLPEKKSYGFIDKKGKLIIPYQYPSVHNLFEAGLAVVRIEGKGDVTAVINAKGETILPADSLNNYQIGVEILHPNEENSFDYYNRHGEAINFEKYELAGTFSRLELPQL